MAGGTPGAGVQFPLQEDTPLLQPSAPASFVPCVPPRGITGIVTADSSVCCGASREIAPVFLGYQLDTGLKMEDKEFTVKKKISGSLAVFNYAINVYFLKSKSEDDYLR